MNCGNRGGFLHHDVSANAAAYAIIDDRNLHGEYAAEVQQY
jgi:hypothetical protein